MPAVLEFLDGDPRGELTEDTPLLEWGILNSLNTAVLIGWIREHFGREIPIEKVNAATFRTVRSLSEAVSARRVSEGDDVGVDEEAHDAGSVKVTSQGEVPFASE